MDPAAPLEMGPAVPFISLNLSEWVCAGTLLGWIEQEIQKLDWSHPMVLDHLRQHPQYRPKAMLRVLSYAYATGVFCSEEIARICQFEAVFNLLCEGRAPFPDELSLFRRRNRKVLERILSQVLYQASEDLHRADRQGERTGLRQKCMAGEAAERLNIARHLDSGE